MDGTRAVVLLSGGLLGVDDSATTSCHPPSDEGEGCGTCDACRLRLKGFQEAGVADPIRYRATAATVRE